MRSELFISLCYYLSHVVDNLIGIFVIRFRKRHMEF